MSLIHQYQHVVLMSQFHNPFQVRANTVIRRVVHQNSHSIGVLFDSLLHLRDFHAQGDTQTVVHIRVHIDRCGTIHNQRINHAPVHVTWQDDFLTLLRSREHHRLHSRSRTSYHQESMSCAKRLCSKVFRLLDDRDRMTQVVEWFHGIHVKFYTLFTQQFHQLRVTAATFVTWHIERNDPVPSELYERLIHWGISLITQFRLVSFNFLLSIWFPSYFGCKCTKKILIHDYKLL